MAKRLRLGGGGQRFPWRLVGMCRQFDIHVALDLAAAAGVDEFLGRLGDDGIAVVIQPVDRRQACVAASLWKGLAELTDFLTTATKPDLDDTAGRLL
jgi:hypothetical protein